MMGKYPLIGSRRQFSAGAPLQICQHVDRSFRWRILPIPVSGPCGHIRDASNLETGKVTILYGPSGRPVQSSRKVGIFYGAVLYVEISDASG